MRDWRSSDNRDMAEMEQFYKAQIETLKKALQKAQAELRSLRQSPTEEE